MPADAPTLREIARRLERIEEKIEEQVTTREAFAGEQKFRDEQVAGVGRRVDKLEESQTWAFRLLIGQFLAFGIGIIFFILEARQ